MKAIGKACEIWLRLGLYSNFSNPANMNSLSCHVEKLPFPSVTSILVILNV